MLGHFVLQKRFNPYRMCLWRRFVRGKRFRWYGKQFLWERFSRGWGGCIETSLRPLMRPAGVGLWRFASLIPSGWRLPPIHKVMGDHASRDSTPAGLFRRFYFCCSDIYIYMYICGLKQQYREICVKMQQSLCELHLCKDG